MLTLRETVKQLGLELPTLSKPGGDYIPFVRRGTTATMAVQFPILDGEFLYRGRLGAELQTADGIAAMQLCALNALAHIDANLAPDNLAGLNHIDAMYLAAGDWDEAARVVDGASTLFQRVLGEKGRHSRTIFGPAHLPHEFCVGLTVTLTLNA